MPSKHAGAWSALGVILGDKRLGLGAIGWVDLLYGLKIVVSEVRFRPWAPILPK